MSDSEAIEAFLPQDVSGLLDLIDLKLGAGKTAEAEKEPRHVIAALLSTHLLRPVTEFLDRPAKGIRGQLVEIGFILGGPRELSLNSTEKELCRRGSELVESIHAGSLVVDDIQDDSQVRRGSPALHLQHGVPLAINAGNWLYFWPLERLEKWNLPPAAELSIHRACHRALVRAHFGQALDIGTPIDQIPQDRISPVCLASLELKTGALMGLATAIGCLLRGGDSKRVEMVHEFGVRFGVALQMFDDIGNLKATRENDPKQYEDLRLKRPSWIWSVASKYLDEADFASFRKSVNQLPNTTPLHEWLQLNPLLTQARLEATLYLEDCLRRLEEGVEESAFRKTLSTVEEIAETLTTSYG